MSKLNTKQIKFLESNSDFIEKLPSLISLYSRMLDWSLTSTEAIAILLYYAESSKSYRLSITGVKDVSSLTTRIRVIIVGRVNFSDKLGLMESSEFPLYLLKSSVINLISEKVESRYGVNLSKLKSLTSDPIYEGDFKDVN